MSLPGKLLHLLRIQGRVGGIHDADQLIDRQPGLHLQLAVLVNRAFDILRRPDLPPG